MSTFDDAFADVLSGTYQQSLPASVLSGQIAATNGGAVFAATRTALAATDYTTNTVAYLSETKRQGWFQWDSSNLSAFVSADTRQGVYVAPASAPTGASGAWVRAYSGAASVFWFGALGDGATDDYAAIQAAVNLVLPVYIPGGFEFKVSDGVQLRSGAMIYGDGYCSKVTSSGTNKRVFWATTKSNITIRQLFINGNLTGAGSTNKAADGGDGIGISDCTNVTISNCTFDNIGRTTSGSFASCIWGRGIQNCLIVANRFLANNGGAAANTGADINLAYYSGRTTISQNDSISVQDSFIYCSAVSSGAASMDTCYHIITDNRGARPDSTVTRSGILIPYAAQSTYSVIANNILTNFPANGIYVGAPTGAIETSAGMTVTGNVVRFCGGASYMTGISSGIFLAGRAGLACSGNVVDSTGLTSAGVARTNPVSGIFIVNTSSNIAVNGNTVTNSTAQGIYVQCTSSTMLDIEIGNNVAYENAGGIYVVCDNPTGVLERLSIIGNTLTQNAVDGDGITINYSTGAPAAKDVSISNNTIVGIVSSTKYGITVNQAGMTGWRINDNTLKNWARGISFGAGAVADREIGTGVVLDGNNFDTCVAGIFANIGAGKYAFHFGSTFRNCTEENSNPGRILAASRLGGNTFEARKSVTPGDGAWLLGDRIIYMTPLSGGFIGEVCTVAGSPGTWKTYGGIS